jgi:hypothetical protein
MLLASTALADDPDGTLAAAKADLATARAAIDAADAKLDAEIAKPPLVTTVTETVTATVTQTVTATPPPPTTTPPTTTAPPPTTTPPPVPGFPTRAQALARANVVVVTGPTAQQVRFGSPPPDTTYDLRGLESTAYPQGHSFPTSFGRDTAGARTVVIGGSVTGTQPRTWTWQQVHADGGAGMTLLGTDFQVSYDFRADNQHDGIQMLPPADANASKYLIEGAYFTWIRDDAIEADDEMSGTIRDVLGEEVNTAISLGQSTRNAAAVTNVSDAIFIHVPMNNNNAADGVGHQTLFKQAPLGTVNMTNVTDCMYENPISPDRIQIRPQGTWTNVTFVLGPGWQGGDPNVPAGADVSRDWQGECIQAADAWRAAHGI